jgi:hypothetical protein
MIVDFDKLRLAMIFLAAASFAQVLLGDEPHAPDAQSVRLRRQLVHDYCIDCHDSAQQTGGLDLESVGGVALERNADVWERVVHKLKARQMPPGDMPRPSEAAYRAIVDSLERSLDAVAAHNPQPGRTSTFRRLTRTEYQNAIRDLLSLQIETDGLLPKDESSQGFDNITVGELSPTLLNRYVSAAEKISRLAVGRVGRSPGGDTFRVPADLTQEDHLPGLPIGTRGGILIPYNFPQNGEYEVRVRLARDRNEEVEGLRGPHRLEVLLDRRRVQQFVIQPPEAGEGHDQVDAHLRARFPVKAGPHNLAVTFPKQTSSLLETMRQPYQAHFNYHRHPRQQPAVYQVSITGPYEATGPGDTPSRRRLFVRQPDGPEDEEACAKEILAALVRRAYRRPIADGDLARPLEFFRQGRADGDFDSGIELALASVLVNPQFLFRIERDPAGVDSGNVYQISDVALASRLSFFLWNSIPDDQLLRLAEREELHRPDVLKQQVQRMLADEKSQAMIDNFASQWLHLRNLDSVHPNQRLFPDFDENLRRAMREETERIFASIVCEDRSVLDLLRSDDTYLNERLARHYGIPHVIGSRFRRVQLEDDSHRGGLLRHGSILTVTSYATRTSPVLRGRWILTNVLGTPPPPPPENVPALKDNTVSAALPVRERLAQHRADASCAVCHDLIDPVGLSLENFDAVGRWRDMEAGQPVDASGGLPDDSEFDGVEGLEKGLLARPDLFVGTLAERLLTYALGRGLTTHDAPAIRRIVRDARRDDFRFSPLIVGIVMSPPFRMRTAK